MVTDPPDSPTFANSGLSTRLPHTQESSWDEVVIESFAEAEPVEPAAKTDRVSGAQGLTERVEELMADDESMAMLSHVLAIPFGFLGPLAIYMTRGDASLPVRYHSAQALNFAIVVAGVLTVCFILMFMRVGLFLFPLALFASWCLQIRAGLAAKSGKEDPYPFNISLVAG